MDSAGTCAVADLFRETSSHPRQDSPLSLHDRAEDKVRKYKEEEPLALSGLPVRWWRKHLLFSLLLSDFT